MVGGVIVGGLRAAPVYLFLLRTLRDRLAQRGQWGHASLLPFLSSPDTTTLLSLAEDYLQERRYQSSTKCGRVLLHKQDAGSWEFEGLVTSAVILSLKSIK